MRARALALTVFLSACGDVPHDAPFDPAAPLDRQARSAVRGEVRLEGETDHSQVAVELASGERTYAVTTAKDGAFAVQGVVPGAYRLRIGARYFDEVSRPVEVALGEELELGRTALALRRAAVTGSARLLDESGRARGGVQVSLTKTASLRAAPALSVGRAPAAAPVASGVSDADGAFTLDGVPAGTYELVAREPGVASTSVAGVTVTGDEAVTVAPVDLKPMFGHLAILGANAAGAVTSPEVTVALDATGFPERVQFAFDPAFLTALPAQDLAATAPVTLIGGDGYKLLYARYFDRDGQVSTVAVAGVVLDTEPPVLNAASLNGGAAYTRSPLVRLVMSATGADEYYVGRGACDQGGVWTDMAPQADVTLGGTDGTYGLYLRLRDRAGNRTPCYPFSVTLDTALAAPALAAALTGAEGVAGRTADPAVTLSIAGLTADVAGLQVAADSGFAAAVWVPAVPSLAWQLSYGDGLKTVYVRAADRAGNLSPTLAPTITLDTAGPDVPAVAVADADGDGYPLSSTTVELQWSASAGAVTYQVERRVSGLGAAFVRVAELGAGALGYIDAVTAGTVGRAHAYRVRALDDLSNASAWSVVVSTTPFAPVTSLAWVRGYDGFRYDFPANRGTFQTLPSYGYKASSDYVVDEVLATNLTSWLRPDAGPLRYDEALTLVSSNADNSLVYESRFDLGLGFTEHLTPNLPNPPRDVRVDAAGRLYAVYLDADYNLYYATNASGAWVRELVEGARDVYDVRLALAGGQPRIVYYDGTAKSIRARSRAAGGWGAPAVTAATFPTWVTFGDLEIDSQGRWHFSWGNPADGKAHYLTYDGAWSDTAVFTFPGDDCYCTALTLDPATERPRIVAAALDWATNDESYDLLSWSGTAWSVEHMYTFNYGAGFNGSQRMHLRIARDGTPHLVTAGMNNEYVDYYTKSAGVWSRTLVDWYVVNPALGLTPDGKVFITASQYNADPVNLYTVDAGVWAKRELGPPVNVWGLATAWFGGDGLRHVLYADANGGLRHWAVTPDVRPVATFTGGAYTDETPDGKLYTLEIRSGSLAYVNSNASGAWQSTYVGTGWSGALKVDAAGRVRAFTDRSTGWYLYTNARGTWEGALAVSKGYSGGGMLFTTAGGHEHLVYQYGTFAATQTRHAYAASITAALTGGWVETPIAGSVYGMGLAAESSGAAHTAFCYGAEITYGTNRSGSWVYEPVASNGYTPNSYGAHPAVALDAAGDPHVAYPAGADADLWYAVRKHGVWAREPVDTAGTTIYGIQLAVAPDGTAYVLYAEGEFSNNVRLATNQSGRWVTATLWDRRNADFPFLYRLADGSLDVSFYTYDGNVWLRDVAGVIPAASVRRR